MGGIPQQKQAPVLHRFNDKTAQGRDAFFDGWARHQLLGQRLWQPGFQFGPEALIRPVLDVLFCRHLQVIAATAGRALAAQGKTALVAGIHQFVMHRRGVGQYAEPTKGIHPFENFQHITRNRLTCDAVKTIAARNVIAVQAHAFAFFIEGDVRRIGFHAVGLDVADAVQGVGTDSFAGRHKVAGDFGLAIDHHSLAAGQALEVDMHPAIIQGQLKAGMHQPFGVHALADTGLAQQVDHALLQHSGANPPEHIVAALAFEDHVINPGVVQQLTEQQPRRTRSNNGDLSSHCCCLA